jgi:hypothetical protein
MDCWTFTTEHSPWKGATYERLIGDTFYTLLTEIEAAINSRPITPVDNKWQDIHMLALRPIDFLCPATDISAPEFDEHDPDDPDYESTNSDNHF